MVKVWKQRVNVLKLTNTSKWRWILVQMWRTSYEYREIFGEIMRILTLLMGSSEYPKVGTEVHNWHPIRTGADCYVIYMVVAKWGTKCQWEVQKLYLGRFNLQKPNKIQAKGIYQFEIWRKFHSPSDRIKWTEKKSSLLDRVCPAFLC
jgi:hypothetical protein